jgi:hypothetical protein
MSAGIYTHGSLQKSWTLAYLHISHSSTMTGNNQPTLSQLRTFDFPSGLTAAASQNGFIPIPHICLRIGYPTYHTLHVANSRPYTPNEAKELLKGEFAEWLEALKIFPELDKVSKLKLEYNSVMLGPARELVRKLGEDVRILLKKRVRQANTGGS